MTIRKKMTLWYTLTLSVLYIGICSVVLANYNPAVQKGTAKFLQEESQELAEDLEFNKGILYWDDEPSTTPGVYYSIFADADTLVFSNHEMNWLNDLPFNGAETVKSEQEGKSWIVVDRFAYEDDQPIAQVRVAYSESSSAQASGTQYMVLLFFIGFPIIALIALIIGSVIAKVSLQPIDSITKTAAKIKSSGELNQRVSLAQNNDEVGRLAQTFNSMLDALQQGFEREQQFTADASHELRTPLSVIIAYSEDALHQKNITPEEYQDSMEVIHRTGQTMQTMLTQMLLLSRMFEGTQQLEKSPLQLDELLFDVSEELSDLTAQKQITLTVNAQPVTFSADLMLFTRMIINLVGNAVRYSEENTMIELNGWQEQNKVIVEVKDHGIGMTPENLEHIFERFYQADPSRKRKGSGLGLAIVQQIVTLHNGTITVQSELGKGSCFRVELPI